MRRFWLIALCSLGCRAQSLPPTQPTPPVTPVTPSLGAIGDAIVAQPTISPGHFVYLRGGTKLLVHPEASSPGLVLSPPAEGFIRPLPARVHTIAGDYIEVETLGPDAERHCGIPDHWTSNFALRGFVKRTAIPEVTTTAWDYDYGDTEQGPFQIQPGLVVDRSGPETMLEAQDFRVPIPVDASAVGHSYQVSPEAPRGDCLFEHLQRFISINRWGADDWQSHGDARGGGSIGLGRIGRVGLIGGTRRTDSRRVQAQTDVFLEEGLAIGKLVRALEARPPITPHPGNSALSCFEVTDPDADGPHSKVCVSAAAIEKPRPPVPRVRQAKPTVGKGLERDIVRRIVRAHINEVRHCYTRALLGDDTLSGRTTIDFTIGRNGKVSAATVASNTVPDVAMGKCIAKAVQRWKFPTPSGSRSVAVTYPFVFEPG